MAKHVHLVLGVIIVLLALFHSGTSQDCGGRICPSHQYCNETIQCEAKKPLGADCTAEGQCAPDFTECLGDEGAKKCQCRSEWTTGPEEKCIVKCQPTNQACSKGFFCSTQWNGCVPQPGLHESCDIDEPRPNQCKPENTTCTPDADENPFCICSPSFIEKDEKCVPKCADSSVCRPYIEFCDASGECLLKKMLGETCSGDDECITDNSACSESACSCETGFSNYFNTTCLPECSTNDNCNTEEEYCDTGNKYCIRRVNLHGNCNYAADLEGQCLDPNAECEESTSTCQCADDYGELNNQCFEICSNHEDCNLNQFCSISTNVCESRLPLGSPCSGESRECMEANNDTNVICKNERCACHDDFYQTGGICQKKCSVNSECDEDKEFCNTGESDELGRCTPKIDLNGICSPRHEGQCKTENAVCNEDNNRCSCVDSHVEGSGVCILKCNSNDDCQSNQFCNSGTRGCQMKYNLTQPCDPSEANEQCKDANSACITNPDTEMTLCSCEGTHAENNAICVARCDNSTTCGTMYCDSNGLPNICKPKASLGQECKYEDQCSLENAMCDLADTKRCQCSSDYYNYNNGVCLKKCTSGEGCSSSDYCTNEGRCEKRKSLGAACTDTVECKTPSAVCDNVCTCPGTHWEETSACIQKCTKTTVCNMDTQYCDTFGKCFGKVLFNQSCTAEDDVKDQCTGKLVLCSTIPDTTRLKCICAEHAAKDVATPDCACTTEYVESQNVLKCLKKASKIGEECEEIQQCYGLAPTPGENDAATTCASNQCTCNTRYVGNSLETKCLKVAENLQDSCEADEQCAELGGTGNARSKCVQSKCTCQPGFLDGSDKQTCRKLAEKVQDDCEEPFQCTVLGEQTECKDKKCQCKAGFVASADAKQCISVTGSGTRMGHVDVYFAIMVAIIVKYFTI